jgi:hypothetical protein
VILTQLATSVQSSSHSFPWCWRIQSRAIKKAPAIETSDQVTTDISGPLLSFGLLTQAEDSKEAIWIEPEISKMGATDVLGLQRIPKAMQC